MAVLSSSNLTLYYSTLRASLSDLFEIINNLISTYDLVWLKAVFLFRSMEEEGINEKDLGNPYPEVASLT